MLERVLDLIKRQLLWLDDEYLWCHERRTFER